MGENSNVVLKTRFCTAKKKGVWERGRRIELGARHDVNES